LWHALSANQPGYTAPMIYEVGGTRQLIIWHPESVNGLDPETGKVYWSVPFKLNAPPCMAIPTPRLDRDRLFITGFYDGSLMLKLDTDKPAASVLWKKKGRGVEPDQTEALHSVMSTPVIADGYIYGDCSYGELRCLKEDTGERVWMTRQPTTTDGKPTRWANVFLTPQGDRYFLFNELGDLIIARLSPQGYDEVSRAHILSPTNTMAPPKGRRVVWTHPAYADKSIFVRNDKEIIRVSLAGKER
jgi:outer membrane protein assembly factor BamB